MALAVEPASAAGPPPESRIGAYTIDRLLGRGGMGVVYLAHRDDVARPVALKRLEGMREPLRERQMLARLEHPAIARLYDGGTTDDGHPYLVLEFIDGVPLDVYCDRHRLDLHDRVRLFRRLLEGVAHAHQHLLIHRDIKPSNVLVTRNGQPKLIDFGIAKRLDGTARTTQTRPLTPAYASPEQLRGEALTTATDTYSLGVLLHHLLTGRSPHRPTSALPHALEAAILEQEPERPSAAFDGPDGAARATFRGGPAAELRRALRGDLDTIVATALRREPGLRYPSVLAFAADLDRWLALLPIQARPDTAGYRLGKFLRRRRGAVAIGAVGLLLAAGLLASLVRQRTDAAHERDRARAALDFLIGVFHEVTPAPQTEREVTAREVLAVAAHRVEHELGGDPELQAALYRAVGQATGGLGRYTDAAPLLARGLSYDRVAHPESSDLAASLEAVGWLDFLRGDASQAREHLEQAVALRRRLAPDSAELAQAVHLLGTVLLESGDAMDPAINARAETLLQQALDIRRRLEGPSGPGVLATLESLVWIAASRGDPQRAEELARQALRLSLERFGPDHPQTAANQRSLGGLLLDQARFAEAVPLFHQALASTTAALPADRPEVATAMAELGLALSRSGQAVEAESYARRAYELTRQKLGEDHRDTVYRLGALGLALLAQGRGEEAIGLFELEIRGEQRLYGEASRIVLSTLGNLSHALTLAGHFDRAEELCRSTLRQQRAAFGPDDPELAWPERNLGLTLSAAGKFSAAEEPLRRSLEILRRTTAPSHFRTARAEILLARCLLRLGRYAEAGALIDHGRPILEAQFPADHERVREARRVAEEWATAQR